MNIVSQLLLIGFLLAICSGVLVAQAIALNRILRSVAWFLFSGAFIVTGMLKVWGLIRLPALILRAQMAGQMPQSLSTEQWVNIGGTFLTFGLFMAGFDVMRRDLRKLGI